MSTFIKVNGAWMDQESKGCYYHSNQTFPTLEEAQAFIAAQGLKPGTYQMYQSDQGVVLQYNYYCDTTSATYVRANGVWMKPTSGLVKVAGAWKNFLGLDEKDMHILTATVSGGVAIALPTKYDTANVKYVDWGDGTIQRDVQGKPEHTYATDGTYTIKAIFDWWNYFTLSLGWLTEIKQFGFNSLTGRRNQISVGTTAFMSSNITDCPAVANLDTSNLTSMFNMFAGCRVFNTDIGDWNTSNVTDMLGVFKTTLEFNKDISTWDMKNVEKADYMFYITPKFNQDLTGWCVAKIPAAPTMFADASGLAPEHMPKWGTCPGSDPVVLTQTASGTWTISNFVTDATYTPGSGMTLNGTTVTSGFGDSSITVKYTNGVELRTYVSRLAYTTHKENHQYKCGEHQCNCHTEQYCHCGTDAPCDGRSWGQCGCPGDMCWYGAHDVCDICPTYCDNWVDVKDATPAGFQDVFGEWTRVATTPRQQRVEGIHDRPYMRKGVHVEGGNIIGWFPIDNYDTEANAPVPTGARSVILAGLEGGQITGYYESNFDSEELRLALFQDDNRWGYLLQAPKPGWLEPGTDWQFIILATDMTVHEYREGTVE